MPCQVEEGGATWGSVGGATSGQVHALHEQKP